MFSMKTLSIPVLCLISLFPPTASAVPPTVDYFFPAGGQRGTTVEVTAGGTFSSWPVKVHVEGKGLAVQPGKASGKVVVTIAADAVPGTHWIRLYNEEGASLARPFLVGTLPEVLEIEPNDDPKKPQLLDKSRVVVNGRLGAPGDVDTFALKLSRGQTLVASLEANRTLRSPMDGIIQVLSEDGFVLDHNNDFHNLDPQLAFVVPKDATYLVRVFAFPSMPDTTIRFAGGDKFVYRLTLTTGGFVDYPFPLAVSRSSPGQVDLVGWNLAGPLSKAQVQAAPGLDKITLFHPELANPWEVALTSHSVAQGTAATNPNLPQRVMTPITISGRLDKAGGSHYYRFDGQKGKKIACRIEARTLGFPLDPVLRLTDSTGNQLAQVQAAALGSDPVLDFTFPHDGLFDLQVRDLHGDGGPRHVYRLHCAPPEPDFGLKLSADHFVVRPGTPLDIPVTLERSYGFSQEVDIQVTGLPKAVTATTLPAAAMGKPLTLRLTAAAISFSGPIRIIGRAKEGPPRVARAFIAEAGFLTENMWLTVFAGKK